MSDQNPPSKKVIDAINQMVSNPRDITKLVTGGKTKSLMRDSQEGRAVQQPLWMSSTDDILTGLKRTDEEFSPVKGDLKVSVIPDPVDSEPLATASDVNIVQISVLSIKEADDVYSRIRDWETPL